MKNKIFDFLLYLQGLKRLRVIGIALAILCITVSMLVPASYWVSEAKYAELDVVGHTPTPVVGGEIMPEEEYYRLTREPDVMDDREVVIPMIVTSYLSPILVLIMFSYLNKRSESDFYHAIPYKRACVFFSYIASVLTWMSGILIVGGLSAGLLWALCPYATYSFGGLVCEILIACLNAALMASFTAAGVSLTGTLATSLIATLLLIGSWRGVLGIAYLCFEYVVFGMVPKYMLGGYLSPKFLLPIAIPFQSDSAKVIIYAIVVTLAMLALGGVLYTKRRSELAGRAVPGRAVHTALRCLITLPVGLLLVYVLVIGEGFATALILFVSMLLVFYLYELLTTKKVKSMLRATPWLAAVVGVCLIFLGAVLLTSYVDENEVIKPERIESVGLVEQQGTVVELGGQSTVVSYYELRQMCEQMSDDPEAIDLVSKAFTQDDDYMSNRVRVRVRIKLKSGISVVRDLRMWKGDYNTLLRELQDDLDTTILPPKDEVRYCDLTAWGRYCKLPEVWFDAIWQALEQDVANLTIQQKADLLRGKYDGDITLAVTSFSQKEGYANFIDFFVEKNYLPLTYQVIESAFSYDTPAVRDMIDLALSKQGKMEIGLFGENISYFYIRRDTTDEALQNGITILKNCLKEGVPEDASYRRVIFNVMVSYEENGQVMCLQVPFAVDMRYGDFNAFMNLFVDMNNGDDKYMDGNDKVGED